MKWLLDADVLSQPAKRNGDSQVIDWLAAEEENCYTSAVVPPGTTNISADQV